MSIQLSRKVYQLHNDLTITADNQILTSWAPDSSKQSAATFANRRRVAISVLALTVAIATPPLISHFTNTFTINKIGNAASQAARALPIKTARSMAWRSSGASNDTLIDNLAQNGLITSERVKEAMKKVDRAHYAPSSPYQDSPQSLGHRATISAPHMHASAAETLLPYLRPGAKVLDVGSGSGYLTHVLAELVQPGGKVVGIEHITPLVEMGRRNVGKSEEGRRLLENEGIVFVKGDGRRGWAEEAPFDAIHVGAAAAGHQEMLIEQLRSPGRLFIPVEEGYMQHIYVVDKDENGKVTKKKEYGVQYVPLVKPDEDD